MDSWNEKRRKHALIGLVATEAIKLVTYLQHKSLDAIDVDICIKAFSEDRTIRILCEKCIKHLMHIKKRDAWLGLDSQQHRVDVLHHLAHDLESPDVVNGQDERCELFTKESLTHNNLFYDISKTKIGSNTPYGAAYTTLYH